MKKELGGKRLGNSNKMTVELDSYPRSTHNKRYVVRTTQSPGTIVPIMNEVGLAGDTWEIKLGAIAKTKAAVGPLFGSFKLQIDVCRAPMRLYQGRLHQNEVDLGLDMANVKFPIFTLEAKPLNASTFVGDLSVAQINPSSILAHLGLMGIGQSNVDAPEQTRSFNGTAWLAYWDFVKNYHCNKQEREGAVIHTDVIDVDNNVTDLYNQTTGFAVPIWPTVAPLPQGATYYGQVIQLITSATQPLNQIMVLLGDTNIGTADIWVPLNALGYVITTGALETRLTYAYTNVGATRYLRSWRYADANDIPLKRMGISRFPLSEIDQMRGEILAYPYATSLTTPFPINDYVLRPWSLLFDQTATEKSIMCSQEGLALSTYNSDLFNNWINADMLNVVNARSNVSTIGGSFSMDALLLARKVFDLYNRIIASGSSVDDWEEAAWGIQKHNRTEIPVYEGGLSQEIIFEEIVSNSESSDQPLGTLAGKGTLGRDREGGHIKIRLDEASVLLAVATIKPRIDYSNGNDWSFHLQSMEDLHVPEYDQIGFANLDAEQAAWWATAQDIAGNWVKSSMGKQPAWMNYRTNVNRVRGNFAITEGEDAESFMVLIRDYQWTAQGQWFDVADITTYIDPVKYNQIFAQTDLNAQNFWMQYGVDIQVTRVMSHRIMPSL